MNKPITILYFAWLRERIGVSHEEMPLPDDVGTVAGLVDYLSARGPRYAAAFENRRSVRCSVNQELTEISAPVRPGDEVAFFPPVTGG